MSSEQDVKKTREQCQALARAYRNMLGEDYLTRSGDPHPDPNSRLGKLHGLAHAHDADAAIGSANDRYTELREVLAQAYAGAEGKAKEDEFKNVHFPHPSGKDRNDALAAVMKGLHWVVVDGANASAAPYGKPPGDHEAGDPLAMLTY